MLQSKLYNTPLHIAIAAGKLNVIKLLVKASGIDLNAVNCFYYHFICFFDFFQLSFVLIIHQNILHIAANQPNPDILKTVLEACGLDEKQTWDFMTLDFFALEKDSKSSNPSDHLDINSKDENDVKKSFFIKPLFLLQLIMEIYKLSIIFY